MMKKLFALTLFLSGCAAVLAQSKNDLQKLVETELVFAAAAEAKGTKAAFLEFLADDGIIFRPEARNGKDFWRSQPDSPALLSWRPAWADVSADGKIGYTTGGWEYRPNGKGGEATAFGQYVTIWKKQENGNYKAILDIGISHENPAVVSDKTVAAQSGQSAPASVSASVGWKSPSDAGLGEKSVRKRFTQDMLTAVFSKRKMSEALFRNLADDGIVLREGKLPMVGRSQIFGDLEKADRDFPPDSYLNFNANLSPDNGNLTYAYGVYKLTHKDKSVNRWNFLQIWKYRDGRWQIALDIMMPIPPENK